MREKDYDNGESVPASGILKAALGGFLTGTGAALALGFLFTAGAYFAEDPDRPLTALAFAALFAGALTAGFAAARFSPGGFAAPGMLAGAMYVLADCLASLLLRSGTDALPKPGTSALIWGLSAALAFFGGYLGRKRARLPGSGNRNPAAMARRRIRVR